MNAAQATMSLWEQAGASVAVLKDCTLNSCVEYTIHDDEYQITLHDGSGIHIPHDLKNNEIYITYKPGE
jgi:hypothetical protein